MIKQIVFWLIFLSVLTFCSLFVIYQIKKETIESNFVQETKQNAKVDLFEDLSVNIPEHESISVILKKTKISANKERYMAEFNQSIEGEEFPLRGSLVLIEEIYFDLDDKYLILPIAVNFGGSGEFIYLVLFKKTPEGLQNVDSLAVGDRIKSNLIEKDIDSLVFKYKSHHIDQSLAEEPIVDTEMNFDVLNDKFVLLEKYFNSRDSIYIKPNEIFPNKEVNSDLSFNFMAKNWLFENTSSAHLYSEDYRLLDKTIASSSDDWMTGEYVNISVNLNAGTYKGKALVVLEADNPSGDIVRDKKMEFWVYIK